MKTGVHLHAKGTITLSLLTDIIARGQVTQSLCASKSSSMKWG